MLITTGTGEPLVQAAEENISESIKSELSQSIQKNISKSIELQCVPSTEENIREPLIPEIFQSRQENISESITENKIDSDTTYRELPNSEHIMLEDTSLIPHYSNQKTFNNKNKIKINLGVVLGFAIGLILGMTTIIVFQLHKESSSQPKQSLVQ